jgi:H+/Cl- antiporter ClcA
MNLLLHHLRLRTRMGVSAGRLHARRAWRMVVMVAVAVLGGLVAAAFAKLCDTAMAAHVKFYARWPFPTLLLLPIGFGLITWATRKLAPEAAGSGIPQVIAAAEHRWSGRWDGQRVTLRTALWKVVLSAAMLLCGGSIGREGPTVQVVAGLMRSLSRGLRGGPGRRAVIIAGGAAGVSAAFNTPIAGVVFAVEELARGFERRTNSFVILVVVVAGFTSYALQGDYAYFGVLQGDPALASAWLTAPLIGVSGGLLGGLFSRGLALVIGPADNPVSRWRSARPVLFAVLCGSAAAVIALISGGLTFGAGYAEAKNVLDTGQGGGITFAIAKLLASFAAACSGAPGGIFAPSLATGAGLGAAFAHLGLMHSGRNAVVLGMAAYLSGVVQAPLTSAVILMEMTREPSLVGPLMLTALVARWTSAGVMPEPLYHVLSRNWLPPAPSHPGRA